MSSNPPPAPTKKKSLIDRVLRRGSSNKSVELRPCKPIPPELLVHSLLPKEVKMPYVDNAVQPAGTEHYYRQTTSDWPASPQGPYAPSNGSSYSPHQPMRSSTDYQHAYVTSPVSASDATYGRTDTQWAVAPPQSRSLPFTSVPNQIVEEPCSPQDYQQTYATSSQATYYTPSSPSTTYYSPTSPQITYYSPQFAQSPENTAQVPTYVQDKRNRYYTLGPVMTSYTNNSVNIEGNNTIAVAHISRRQDQPANVATQAYQWDSSGGYYHGDYPGQARPEGQRHRSETQ